MELRTGDTPFRAMGHMVPPPLFCLPFGMPLGPRMEWSDVLVRMIEDDWYGMKSRSTDRLEF